MKKLLLLFLLFFTTDSYSSGIASNAASAPCTNNTLETYSGNSNLAADWQPNTINLRWYNGNTLLDVQSTANTCVYDGSLTIPSTAPSRIGYTFDGWQVRPQMDFAATIPINIEGTYRWSRGVTYNTNEDKCYYRGQDTDCNRTELAEIQRYEWKTGFSHGVLYGMSKCSAKSGSNGVATNFTDEYLDSVAGDKKYCWCRATGYKPNNSNVIYAPSSVLSWVYDQASDTIEYCSRACANACAAYAQGNSYFRTALFTPVQ